jgi:hypothetical protein
MRAQQLLQHDTFENRHGDVIPDSSNENAKWISIEPIMTPSRVIGPPLLESPLLLRRTQLATPPNGRNRLPLATPKGSFFAQNLA